MFSEAAVDRDDVPETELVAWIDAIADRYEAAWQALTPPRLEDFLGDVGTVWPLLEDVFLQSDSMATMLISSEIKLPA